MAALRDRRPNVILIVADDLGYGDLAIFGNPVVRTPHLDALAHRGVLLSQHYSGSPICAPARAAILTGRYNHRTGAVDVPSNRGLDRIALSEQTIADRFKSAGYATGMVGKWHNGVHDMRYHPNSRGFDEFAGFLNGGMDYWEWVLDYNGSPRPSDGRYLTDVFTEEAIGFIERHRREPFFLYLPYNAPHGPLQAPDRLVESYLSAGDFTGAVARIYAMIEIMDAGIGRVMETLSAHGLAEDILVVFTSDNGPALGGEGDDNYDRYNGIFRGGKYDALEGGIRVPAIAHWPAGLPGGRRCDDLVHFIDWLPTLVGLTGADLPGRPALDGSDVLSVLRGERGAAAPVRFWQFSRYQPVARSNGAMRDGRWKLYFPEIPEARKKDRADNVPYFRFEKEAHMLMDIDLSMPHRTLSPPQPPQLFDLDEDPYELADLADAHPDRADSMTRRWDSWFEEVAAEWWDAQKSTRSNS